jgi:hypothetical protein
MREEFVNRIRCRAEAIPNTAAVVTIPTTATVMSNCIRVKPVSDLEPVAIETFFVAVISPP